MRRNDTLKEMRKFAVVIIFLLFAANVASPVYAADSQGNRWSFGSLIQSFLGRPSNPSFTPRPTNKPHPTGLVVPTRGPFNHSNTVTPRSTPHPTGADRAAAVERVVNSTLDNYQRRLNQYNDFLTKVKSRRDKLVADGKDVTQLDAFIATATTNVTNAQTVLDSVKSDLAALDYSGDVSTIRKDVQSELTKVRQAFTDLHKSMSDVVSEIVKDSAGTTTPFPTRVAPSPRVFPTMRNQENHGNPVNNGNNGFQNGRGGLNNKNH